MVNMEKLQVGSLVLLKSENVTSIRSIKAVGQDPVYRWTLYDIEFGDTTNTKKYSFEDNFCTDNEQLTITEIVRV